MKIALGISTSTKASQIDLFNYLMYSELLFWFNVLLNIKYLIIKNT